MSLLAILKRIGITALLSPVFKYTQPGKQLVKLDVAHPTQTCVVVFPEVIMAGTPTQPFHPANAMRMYNSGPDTPLVIPFDSGATFTSAHASKNHHILPKSTYNGPPHAMAPAARILFMYVFPMLSHILEGFGMCPDAC
jgi:hypothetical protein